MNELPVTIQELTAWQVLASHGSSAPVMARPRMTEPNCAYAVLVDGRLYAYGRNREQAIRVFREQINGGLAAHRASMWDRAVIQPLEDAEASEIAECIAADAICWG